MGKTTSPREDKKQNAPQGTVETAEQVDPRAEEEGRGKCIIGQYALEQENTNWQRQWSRQQQQQPTRETSTNPRENEKHQNTPRETAEPEELTAGNEERGKCLTEQHTWGQKNNNEHCIRSRSHHHQRKNNHKHPRKWKTKHTGKIATPAELNAESEEAEEEITTDQYTRSTRNRLQQQQQTGKQKQIPEQQKNSRTDHEE